MNHIEKKRQLEGLIEQIILPMIDSDYVLYGLPYYNNIGDTLIWNGELELLKKVKHKCIGVCGWNSYPGKKLPEDVIILITGGGYFGDLWRYGWQSVLDGIAPNKKNKIIVLPNTIYYQDESLRDKDAEFLSHFPHLIICARDKVSYQYAQKYFSNQVELVPDMAFCMSERLLKKWSNKPSQNVLLFKRNDKECPEIEFAVKESHYDIHDWYPMEKLLPQERRFNSVIRRLPRLRHINAKLPALMHEMLYRHYYRKLMTKLGMEQISSYSKIYTTRLHAMILGVMLGREIVMIDNRFGKLSSFYNTWLTDCDNLTAIN